MPKLIHSVFLLSAISTAFAQTPPPTTLSPIAPIALDTAGPVLRAPTDPFKPFTVAGEHGVLVGQQNGVFESWILPVKLLSHFTIEADVEGYGVPIDVNQQSAAIEVRPDRTTITYSHPAFTVRQIMFSPASEPSQSAPSFQGAQANERVGGQSNPATGPAQTGPIVLFEFDCLHPTLFTFRFTPELKWMWPERNEGIPGAEWVSPDPHNPIAANGYYVLHADYPNLAAAITIPGAEPGILAPYQERPQFHPLELKLHIDPARDHGKLFPLLMAAGITPAAATNTALASTLAQLNAQIPALYTAHAESWKNQLAHATSISTPDQTLNEAFQWAVISIEQLKTKTIPGQSSPPGNSVVSGHDLSRAETSQKEKGALAPESKTALDSAASVEQRGLSTPPQGLVTGHGFSRAEDDSKREGALAPEGDPETALVAGYFTSADSARPGFGWFFGRDALYTLYAVNGYGDFALSKSELEFLIHRQRADGKIMHEYSQTAAAIDWQSFPYMYAAADSTPLFLLATADYVRSSGDTAFLTTHRDAIEKAWAFETDPAHDTDHDGIYDNSQGTGWVESWPGGMPHQEIYLALLDQQASSAMAWIEVQLKEVSKAETALHRADTIAKTINIEYYDPQKSCYAFSDNSDGTNDRTTTVYPALAWWDPTDNPIPTKPSPAKPLLDHSEQCLRNFVASALNTDWGSRDVSNEERIYDGLSYHQGSVWPLFTGWAALAEYRGNQPLAGYQLLMENANLTRAQDLGAVTELLSGDFYVPFGRSTSHQLWSSAMVITPTLRGLFGITIDAQSKTITVNPHLPASWDHATVDNLPLPGGAETLWFERKGQTLVVSVSDWHKAGWQVKSTLPGLQGGKLDSGFQGVRIQLSPVEIEFARLSRAVGIERVHTNPMPAPIPGSRTSQARVISEQWSEHKASIVVEGAPGTSDTLILLRHELLPRLRIDSPQNEGAQAKDIPQRPVYAAMIDSAAHDVSEPIYVGLNFPAGAGFQTITVTLTW